MIYLDNAANTFVCYTAQKAMLKEISSVGNPSSIHFLGESARRRLERAEESILKNNRHILTKNSKIIVTYIYAIYKNFTLSNIVITTN